MNYAIGIDLGGTNVKAGGVDKKGKILFKTSLPTEAEKGYEHVVSQIEQAIEIVIEKKGKPNGIGVGAPGVVDFKTGEVKSPPNLPGWERVNLKKILEKKFKLRAVIENDANAAAIGEYIYGAGGKTGNFIMVTLGTGVGGGIFFGGKLFRGETGGAGEIGHITINYRGRQCNCGSYGCIEAYVGNSRIVADTKKKIKIAENSVLLELLDGDLSLLTPKIIFDAAKLGDEFSREVIAQIGEMLGAALASAINLLDISTVIIGGGVSGFGKFLFEPLRASVKNRVLAPLRPRVKILRSKLGNDAGLKGAASLVYYKE